jgi:ABC-type amino acid transport substrate-binding protein
VVHDVFISYSHHDKPEADAVCSRLEAQGIRCWIAPRDVVPGEEWGAAIVDAIRSSRVMVVVFSQHANTSPQIRREVERAVIAEVVLIPFRIEDVAPERGLEFFLGTPHWLDALTPPLEAHLERLAIAVSSHLGAGEGPFGAGTGSDPNTTVAGAQADSLAQASPLGKPITAPSLPSRKSPARLSRRVLAAVGAVLLVVAFSAVGVWRFWPGRGETAVVLPEGAIESIALTVPEDIRTTGRLIIGVNVPYAPNEFKTASGEIVGFDVDLMNAVARTLGLVPEYRETAFEAIIPSVRAGDFNVGMSSFTDTKERESTTDFVTYFEAGTLWARRPGSSVDPSDACGAKIGVTSASIQGTVEIPAKSNACIEAGKSPLEKVAYVRQDDLTAALIARDVDAMSADSPVTGFAIKTSGGALEPAGEVFDSAPYGWPVAKASKLAVSLRQALEDLMQTGVYRTIATKWGVEKGMIDKPRINGAIR